MSHQLHRPWFDNRENTWQKVHLMMFPIMQFFNPPFSSCRLVPDISSEPYLEIILNLYRSFTARDEVLYSYFKISTIFLYILNMNSHNEIFCYVEWFPSQYPRGLRHAQRYIGTAKGSLANIPSGVGDCVRSVRVCLLSYASKGHRVAKVSKDMRLICK